MTLENLRRWRRSTRPTGTSRGRVLTAAAAALGSALVVQGCFLHFSFGLNQDDLRPEDFAHCIEEAEVIGDEIRVKSPGVWIPSGDVAIAWRLSSRDPSARPTPDHFLVTLYPFMEFGDATHPAGDVAEWITAQVIPAGEERSPGVCPVFAASLAWETETAWVLAIDPTDLHPDDRICFDLVGKPIEIRAALLTYLRDLPAGRSAASAP